MADLQKYYDCGKPTLIQGGWQRAGAGNAYVEFLASTNRISTLDFVPTGHPNNIKVTGIASKTLEVSALVLRNDNYIIEAYGWQANGAEFNVGDSYDKLGIMFRFQDNSDITPSDVEVQELGEWQHSLRKMSTATEAVENPLYSDGTAITAYSIKGNTTTSGTPSPSNPITISGVGNKTANLFNKNGTDTNNGYVADNYLNPYDGNVGSGSSNHIISEYIDISAYSQLTLSGIGTSSSTANSFYDENKSLLSYFSVDEVPKTVNVPQNAKYIRLTVYKPRLGEEMLNGGSTALPYEPYGYKIPISSGQVAAVNYLGSVQSTRQIKKLVLTGQESFWTDDGTVDTRSRYRILPTGADTILRGNRYDLYCTHFKTDLQVSANSVIIYNGTIGVFIYFYVLTADYPTLADFKTYIQQQYANGTPVILYYILATPTTDIVNEPLMKIGDYSDSIANATAIPTIEGANSIIVDTTVQPSEFSATWTGWHDSSVKEYDGSDWQ